MGHSGTTLAAGVHMEPELTDIVGAFGFKTPQWTWVESEDGLLKVRYPAALKVFSGNLMHKTEAGAVRVNVRREDAMTTFKELHRAFPDGRVYAQEMVSGVEIRVGVASDSAFGKYIDIGAGGVLTELLRDHSTRIAPVTPSEASKMLEELKMAPLLRGYRGGVAADLASLADSISSLSAWAASLKGLREMEINPLIVNRTGSYAVDVRATVEP